MKLQIKRSEIFIAVILFLVINIDSWEHLLPDVFASLLNTWIPLVTCIGLAFLMILQKRKLSRIFILICIFWGAFIVITLLQNPNAILAAIAQLLSPFAICFLAEYYMPQKPREFLRAAQAVLIVLILADIFTILVFPEGMYSTTLYSENWFLGYKSARVRAATLPVIMFAALLSVKEKNKLDLKFWIISALALFDTILSGGTGASLSIVIMLAMLAVLYIPRSKNWRRFIYRLFDFKVLLIVAIALTVFISVFQNYSFLEPIINGLLDKSMTLSGRIRIWNVVFLLLASSPIIGSGYITSSNFVALVGMNAATQPHSLFLGILAYMGIFGVILFIIMLVYALSKVNKDNYGTIAIICNIYIFAILIHGIISMHMFSDFLYASMIMIFYLKDVKYDSKKGNSSTLMGRERDQESTVISGGDFKGGFPPISS